MNIDDARVRLGASLDTDGNWRDRPSALCSLAQTPGPFTAFNCSQLPERPKRKKKKEKIGYSLIESVSRCYPAGSPCEYSPRAGGDVILRASVAARDVRGELADEHSRNRGYSSGMWRGLQDAERREECGGRGDHASCMRS